MQKSTLQTLNFLSLIFFLTPFLMSLIIPAQVLAKKVTATIDGKEETRVIEDCDKAIKYQSRALSLKFSILDKIKVEGETGVKAIRDAGELLGVLQWQSRQLCEDWNTFRVTRQEYNQKAEWMRNTFATFALILEKVKLKDLEKNPEAQKEFIERLTQWTTRTNAEKEEIYKKLGEMEGLIREGFDLVRSDIRELNQRLAGNVRIEDFSSMVEKTLKAGKETFARLDELPKEVDFKKEDFPKTLKGKIYYDSNKKQLIFKGVMKEEEKQQLLVLSSEGQWHQATEAIFRSQGSAIKEPAERFFASANDFFELGKKRASKSMFEEAVERYRKALDYLPSNSEAAASIYYNLGNSYAYMGKWDNAKQEYLNDINIIEPLKESALLADNYRNMGYLPINYKDADLWYEKSLLVSRRIGYREGEVKALFNVAEVYYKRAEYARALKRYLEAKSIYEQEKNKEGEALVNDSLARTYNALGQYEKALEAQDKAITVYRLLGDKIGEASCIATLGDIYKQQGKHEEAYKTYQEALKLYEEQEDFKGKASVLKSLGEMYEEQEKIEEALSAYLRSMRAYKEIGEKRGRIGVLNKIAAMYFLQGKPEEALRSSNEARDLSKELSYPEGEKQSLYNIMKAYFSLNKMAEAGTTAEVALDKAGELLWKKEERADLENVLGIYYCSTGQFDKGIMRCQDALDIYREINNKKGEADSLYFLGKIHCAHYKYEEALKSYEQSIKLCQEIGNRSKEALALSGLAMVYFHYFRQGNLEKGNLEEAFNTCKKAYNMLQETGDEAKKVAVLENLNQIHRAIKELYDEEYIAEKARKRELEKLKTKLAQKEEEEARKKTESQKFWKDLLSSAFQPFAGR